MKSIARLGIGTLKSIGAKPIGARDATAAAQSPYNFPPFHTTNTAVGTYSWSVPMTGFWKFVAWGAGGGSNTTNAGGSGSYGEVTRFLQAGEIVSIAVGAPGATSPNTTLTIRGEPFTAGGANGATAGVASGAWDYSLNGSTGVPNAGGANGAAGQGTGGGAGGQGSSGNRGGGAGAPARLPFRGGQGGGANSPRDGGGGSPGAGGGWPNTNDTSGGEGLVLALFVRS